MIDKEAICVVPGCDGLRSVSHYTRKVGLLCDKHWQRMPLGLRREWWRETEYGDCPPSKAFIDRLVAFFNRGAE